MSSIQNYDQCVKFLKKNNVVCEGCGGKLEPIETVDNANNPTYWIVCRHCNCLRVGIEKEYWEIARKLILDNTIIPYQNMDRSEYNTPEGLEYYLNSQTAGLSHIIKEIHEILKEKFKKRKENMEEN